MPKRVCVSSAPTGIKNKPPGFRKQGGLVKTEAILSFNSKSETEVMVEWFGDETDTPQGYATNYYFPNGKRGFLPSAGVGKTIADNFSSIHNAFDKLEIHFYAYYLALSTFEAIGTGNAFVWHLYMLNENSISLGTRDVTNGSYLDVYPITDLS